MEHLGKEIVNWTAVAVVSDDNDLTKGMYKCHATVTFYDLIKYRGRVIRNLRSLEAHGLAHRRDAAINQAFSELEAMYEVEPSFFHPEDILDVEGELFV